MLRPVPGFSWQHPAMFRQASVIPRRDPGLSAQGLDAKRQCAGLLEQTLLHRRPPGRVRGRWIAMPAAAVRATAIALALLSALAGCAGYQPLPLPVAPPAAPGMPAALDLAALVTQALARSPDLVAARDQARVARAQAFAAGLPPDPSLALALDRPTSADPLLVDAFTLGGTLNLSALLTRPWETAAARATAQAAEWTLAWQAWQVVSRAQTLFIDARSLDAQRAVLDRQICLLTGRVAREQAAVEAGDLTVDVLDTERAALADAVQKHADLGLQIQTNRADLGALLGLPGPLHARLGGDIAPPALPDEAAIEALLTRLPGRRPDLAALRAGYASQDAKLRAELLRQFPALGLGANRARDTSAIYSTGLSLDLVLPLFNRNRGNIALARATRLQLGNAYRARLADAAREVRALAVGQRLRRAALVRLDAVLPGLRERAAQAQEAAAAGNLDAGTAYSLEQAALAQELNRLLLARDLARQAVQLATLLGSLPPPGPPSPGNRHAPTD